MPNGNHSGWKNIEDFLSEDKSETNATIVELFRNENIAGPSERTTASSSKGKKAIRPRLESELDQLSDASLNFVTPSPKQVAKEIDTQRLANIVIKPSAIDIDSDERITTEEFNTIKKTCATEWVIDVLTYVRGLASTKRLNKLIRLWYRIEELNSFPDVDGRNNEYRLFQIQRPDYFDVWMQSHRPLKKNKVPNLNFEESFFPQFQLWWSILQPAWRTTLHSEPFTKTSPDHTDWSKLCRAGPNGITLIVLSLSLGYVTWAFKQIIKWIEMGCPVDPVPTKRKMQSETSKNKNVKKRKENSTSQKKGRKFMYDE